jgi:hypothetical protein
LGPVLHLEIRVALQIDVAPVAFRNRKEEADLRTDTDRLSFERAELRTRPAVARELLVVIADEAAVSFICPGSLLI